MEEFNILRRFTTNRRRPFMCATSTRRHDDMNSRSTTTGGDRGKGTGRAKTPAKKEGASRARNTQTRQGERIREREKRKQRELECPARAGRSKQIPDKHLPRSECLRAKSMAESNDARRGGRSSRARCSIIRMRAPAHLADRARRPRRARRALARQVEGSPPPHSGHRRDGAAL